MWTEEITVRVHDTDSTGVLFFANQFRMAHDLYEDFMESMGFGFAFLFEKSTFLLPMVHTEADFKQPLFVGDHLILTLKVEALGTRSYTMLSTFMKNHQLAGSVRCVHVSVDKITRKAIPLPDPLLHVLQMQWQLSR